MIVMLVGTGTKTRVPLVLLLFGLIYGRLDGLLLSEPFSAVGSAFVDFSSRAELLPSLTAESGQFIIDCYWLLFTSVLCRPLILVLKS